MKLYIYEHCPFCVRARMIFGLRQIPYETVVLLNDDEQTPIDLIGSKQVPILQKNDGSHMGESLDIVRYVDEWAKQTRLNETIRPEVQAWFDDVATYVNKLIMPRDIQLNLPEFATQSAIDYFVAKKEKNIGHFAEQLANTPELLAKIHADLLRLDQWVLSSDYLNGQEWSMEDIIVFPILRNLSMVKDIVYPENVLAYVHKMSQQSGVNLYFERAL